MSFSQCFMPVYFLFFESNIFEIKNSPKWAFVLVMLHITTIFILFLQKKLGARFFIPKRFRSNNDYNYYTLPDDIEADGDKDCAI